MEESKKKSAWWRDYWRSQPDEIALNSTRFTMVETSEGSKKRKAEDDGAEAETSAALDVEIPEAAPSTKKSKYVLF